MRNKMNLPLSFSYKYFDLGEAFYSQVNPRPLKHPTLTCWDSDTAKLIGLEEIAPELATRAFSGNAFTDHHKTLAMVYAGHQFGGYSPELGDGRGVLLGEVAHQGHSWDIHLKGAGKTPYSRFGDGYAVLRSCIREYLASIAMRSLNIPTTHALCVVKGCDPVQREQIEPAAMLTRVARTHVRFGTFEYFHYRQQYREVQQLADFVIAQFMPDEYGKAGCYEKLLAFITHKTANLIANWQAVGFSHGVINTDNMSICGETLDYGPYGFMERFNAEHVCNLSDHHGRYAFDRQPGIGLWNLHALAAALQSLVDQDSAQQILDGYTNQLLNKYHKLMQQKLGLMQSLAIESPLLEKLFSTLQQTAIDYSQFFRKLSYLTAGNWREDIVALTVSKEKQALLHKWLNDYQELSKSEKNSPLARQALMLQCNPKFILRNHLAQQAIDSLYKEDDSSALTRLEGLLKTPFDEHTNSEAYAMPLPEGQSAVTVSCSS